MSEIKVTKESIALYSKELKLPTFNHYHDIIRQLDKDKSKAARYPNVKTIDELSYVSFSRHQSDLLFKVILDRSEKGGIIITTNLEFSRWIELFDNATMVSVLVDRITFPSQVLNMNGDSYRKDNIKEL